MSEKNRYDLMLEALIELAPEIRALDGPPKPVLPTVSSVMARFNPLPAEALFLGVAEDGLPVLLNVEDPVPGPVLIVGDAGTGKTNFLKSIASGVQLTHADKEIQYGIITSYLEEWNGFQRSSNCVDIFPAHKTDAENFINSVSSWAHSSRRDSQAVLLLIDDITSIFKMDFEARQSLRWLLLRGPSRKVWPIITMNPDSLNEIHPWDTFFHTRIFGKIDDQKLSQTMTQSENVQLQRLNAGAQFMIREDDQWLKFWVPSAE